MRFKGKLKEKIDKAKTKEQTVEILDKAGIELTDEELETVSGGLAFGKYTPPPLDGGIKFGVDSGRPK